MIHSSGQPSATAIANSQIGRDPAMANPTGGVSGKLFNKLIHGFYEVLQKMKFSEIVYTTIDCNSWVFEFFYNFMSTYNVHDDYYLCAAEE